MNIHMKNLEDIGKEMPYSIPEHFMEDVTERIVARIEKPVKKKGRSIYIYLTVAAGAAAMAILLLHPFGAGSLSVPDYETISECKSIDEVVETMSADDLGLFTMMSNYYGE
jgi:hypothetical protein